MSRRFAVVHEAPADFSTATQLADRELLDALSDWLTDDLLPHQRTWVEEAAGEQFTWKAIPTLARNVGIRAHGHFDGEPGEADAAAARRALLYILHVFPDVDAVLLVRDQDDQPERRKGLEQARTHDRSGKPIVIGLAVVERESWVISGYEPQDIEEQTRFAGVRQGLPCDPRTHSHELTACKNDNAVRSPKRVLRELTQDDRDREVHCWNHTPLSLLKERGTENGLASYLAEVREHLAPLIGS